MWLYFGIFVIEFAWSWISNRANINIIKRRPLHAGIYGLVGAAMSWAIPLYVYIYSHDPFCALPAIIGDALGDFLAARRKGKPAPEGVYGYKGPVNV